MGYVDVLYLRSPPEGQVSPEGCQWSPMTMSQFRRKWPPLHLVCFGRSVLGFGYLLAVARAEVWCTFLRDCPSCMLSFWSTHGSCILFMKGGFRNHPSITSGCSDSNQNFITQREAHSKSLMYIFGRSAVRTLAGIQKSDFNTAKFHHIPLYPKVIWQRGLTSETSCEKERVATDAPPRRRTSLQTSGTRERR